MNIIKRKAMALSFLFCLAIIPFAYSAQENVDRSNGAPNNYNDSKTSPSNNSPSEDPGLIARGGGGGGGHGGGGGWGGGGGHGNWGGGGHDWHGGGDWDHHGGWDHGGGWDNNYWGGGVIINPGYGYYDNYGAPYDPYYYNNGYNNGYYDNSYYTPQY